MAEHTRRSLVDDSMTSSAPAKKSKSGGGSGNGLKIGIIVVCLGVAAVLLGYQFGVIPNPFAEKPKPPDLTPTDNKVIEDYQKQNDAVKNQPNPPVLGGS